MRDIRSGKDKQVASVVAVIVRNKPDIIALQGIDWDLDGIAVQALKDALAEAGHPMPHHFAARPNSGMRTGLDMNGDGRLDGPEDAQGFGRFTGAGGMAVLSRFPIRMGAVTNLSDLLWKDLPDAEPPRHPDGRIFPSPEVWAIQRLSSTGHWIVPIDLEGGHLLTLLTFQAAPPVFDGPEDRNGLRNQDEIRLWRRVLDEDIGPGVENPVIAGGANLDPNDGEGRHSAIQDLLTHPRLQDPRPASAGAAVDTAEPGHAELVGADALDTVDWPRVGRLRVDYVIPGIGFKVVAAGVDWPLDATARDPAMIASRHRLVWVDVQPALQ